MISVYIKKLEESAIVPTRATDTDAGYDLYSINDGVVPAGGRKVVGTGIAIAIPESKNVFAPSYYGRVAPRSGLAVKKGIDVLAGVVDAGYRGEVGVVLQNLSDEDFPYKKGDRVAQLILEQCNTIGWVELDELEDSERSDGGFGSTGS
jgi:dUTP pyrophosphatase